MVVTFFFKLALEQQKARVEVPCNKQTVTAHTKFAEIAHSSNKTTGEHARQNGECMLDPHQGANISKSGI